MLQNHCEYKSNKAENEKVSLVFLLFVFFVYVFIYLFIFCFEHDYFLVQKKTEISDNHVSGYSRHGGSLM